MNYIDALKNVGRTANGAVAYNSTLDKVYDLFALGGAYRDRNAQDKIDLFTAALGDDQDMAIVCLFYLRDILHGQGERELFKLCLHALALAKPEIFTKELVALIPEYGRFDDLYCFDCTPVERVAFDVMQEQFLKDLDADHPSLLGKWLKSENASSAETKRLATKTRMAFGLDSKHYRKALSYLRDKIKIVEDQMSHNQWSKIDYEAIPSKAGLLYRNAFMKHDGKRYMEVMASDKTKVNAGTLYPYDVIHKALDYTCLRDANQEKVVNKYWENLTDYFDGKNLNAMCMIDTSGSMGGRPMEVAISLGIYCAERMGGPFANHFMTFSSKPTLVEVEGNGIVEKANKIRCNCIVENTNIKAAFDLLLRTAIRTNAKQEDIPENLIIITDGQFDAMVGDWWMRDKDWNFESDMECVRKEWAAAGYKLPKIIYWNVNAWGKSNIVDDPNHPDVTFISGFSPSIFEQVIDGNFPTGKELMHQTLTGERYAPIWTALGR